MDQETCQYSREDYTIDTDRQRLDLDIIHAYLTHSYWCPGIPRKVLAKAVDHSLCFGLYRWEEQIGFARVVTDYARFAYLCDLFVLSPTVAKVWVSGWSSVSWIALSCGVSESCGWARAMPMVCMRNTVSSRSSIRKA